MKKERAGGFGSGTCVWLCVSVCECECESGLFVSVPAGARCSFGPMQPCA